MSTKRQWFTAFVGAGHSRHAAVGTDPMHLEILCGALRPNADGTLLFINHVDPYKLEAVTCKRCIAQLAMGPSGPKD